MPVFNPSGSVGEWIAAANNAAGVTYLNVESFKIIRTEAGGAVARLRGQLEMAAAKNVAAKAELITLKPGFEPVKPVIVAAVTTAGTVIPLEVTGTKINVVLEFAEGKVLQLDGITWNLK